MYVCSDHCRDHSPISDFAEQFHPEANVEKMSAGFPLTDADRWDWLIQLREVAVDALDTGVSGVVLTCSALKRKYRDVIRVARLDDHDVLVHFIYLRASEELLLQRVKARKGHYMKPSMIKSQLQSLEEPKEKERDVLSIDVSGSKADVQRMALDAVRGVMAQDMVGSRKS
jgi:gluconokinase